MIVAYLKLGIIFGPLCFVYGLWDSWQTSRWARQLYRRSEGDSWSISDELKAMRLEQWAQGRNIQTIEDLENLLRPRTLRYYVFLFVLSFPLWPIYVLSIVWGYTASVVIYLKHGIWVP